jgi:tol-pal system protein YbgF
MKLLRLAALALTCSVLSFGASKEIVELQRDVALLQDKVDAMQRNLATKIDQLTGMVQAMQDNNTRTVAQLATLQDSVASGVSRSLAPVSGLSTKVDSMGDDVRSLKDALNDLSARLERMDAKITDVKNQVAQMQIAQNPPPAPGSASSTGPAMGPGGTQTPGSMPGPQPGQGSAAVPPGMSADQSYTDAVRDMQGNKIDLAYQEFTQYLTYFPNTERAANAQFYIGQIDFNRGDYNGAVQAFDAVLERYPENPKTPDAHLMKGMALLRLNQRNRAVQEFRLLVGNYPHTNDALKAQQELRQLGVSVSSVPAPTRRKQE